MSALAPALVLAILVVIAMLAPLFGADSRPGVQDPPEAWFRQGS